MENSRTNRKKKEALPIKSGKITAIQVISVVNIILMIVYVIIICAAVSAITGFVFLLLMIFPCCCGLVPLNKLSSTKYMNQLTAWCILNLFFFNPITGVLFLCLTNKELAEYKAYVREQQMGINNNYSA